jgi:hypothetical protein
VNFRHPYRVLRKGHLEMATKKNPRCKCPACEQCGGSTPRFITLRISGVVGSPCCDLINTDWKLEKTADDICNWRLTTEHPCVPGIDMLFVAQISLHLGNYHWIVFTYSTIPDNVNTFIGPTNEVSCSDPIELNRFSTGEHIYCNWDDEDCVINP